MSRGEGFRGEASEVNSNLPHNEGEERTIPNNVVLGDAVGEMGYEDGREVNLVLGFKEIDINEIKSAGQGSFVRTTN